MKTEDLTQEQAALLQHIEKAFASTNKTVEQQKAASQSFVMNGKYQLRHNAPAITAGPENIVLVNPGEIATFVALPGTGKTQVCEALSCAYVADLHRLEDIDTLGLKCFSTANQKCLYVDTERPHDDNFKSYERIIRRIGADKNNSLITETSEVSGLDYRCFVALSDTQIIKDEIVRLCSETKYGLIVIDGALDLVNSMNSEEECKSMVKWLLSLANDNGTAIAVTLHPNKGTDTMAGHLGAMLYRYSRACLAITPHQANSSIKVLTNQFKDGKLSHGGFDINTSFKWDDATRMMLSLPDEATPVSGRVKVSREAIQQLFNSYAMAARFWIPSSEVKSDYAERFNKSDKTAKDHIIYAVQQRWIEKRGATTNTEYRYANTEE